MIYYKYEREKYIMKTMIVFLTILWFGLTTLNNSVKADEYNTAVIGHVVSETIKGTDIDHQKLLEAEMSKMAHTFTLQLVNVLQEHLPYIMDSVMTQLRLDLDKKHKCLLLKDSKIGDKECQDKKTQQ
jgi:hypothetical protein